MNNVKVLPCVSENADSRSFLTKRPRQSMILEQECSRMPMNLQWEYFPCHGFLNAQNYRTQKNLDY